MWVIITRLICHARETKLIRRLVSNLETGHSKKAFQTWKLVGGKQSGWIDSKQKTHTKPCDSPELETVSKSCTPEKPFFTFFNENLEVADSYYVRKSSMPSCNLVFRIVRLVKRKQVDIIPAVVSNRHWATLETFLSKGPRHTPWQVCLHCVLLPMLQHLEFCQIEIVTNIMKSWDMKTNTKNDGATAQRLPQTGDRGNLNRREGEKVGEGEKPQEGKASFSQNR